MTAPARAVGFAECCRRIGVSIRTGRRWVALGTFPIPAQPRQGRRRLYSTVHIDHWLTDAATADVARHGRQRWSRAS